MLRREFIRRSLAALPAIALAPALLQSCKREDLSPIDTDQRIIIVGAGISGLAAAWYFNQRGVQTTVLEARDRIGGRIATDRSAGFPFDLGASWIHGPRRNPISDLADDAGANTFKTKDNSVKVYRTDGTAYGDGLLDDAEKEFQKALEKTMENGSVDQSFKTVFEAQFPDRVGDQLWTYMLSAYLEFDSGGDIDRLSSLDFEDDETYGGADLIITNGYDKLTDYLSTGLDIRLEQPVRTIDYSGGVISIATDSGSYEADLLVLTAPLGVLKEKDIIFNPGLPDSHQGAVDRLEMGAVNKYLLLWGAPFWDTSLQYIGYTPEERGKFNYFLNTRTFSDTNGLMTFSFGDYSRQAEDLDDSEITTAIMDHLRVIYPGAPDPDQLLRTRWSKDEFSHGAYSFASNGTRTIDFDLLAEPIDNRIFLAGEHTSRDYRGTVHGAYESGLREGRRIAELLGG